MNPKRVIRLIVAYLISSVLIVCAFHFYSQYVTVYEANKKLEDGYKAFLYGSQIKEGTIDMVDAFDVIFIDDKERSITIERNGLWKRLF